MMLAHAPGVVKTRYKRLQGASPPTVTEIAILVTVALACLAWLIDLAQFMGIVG